jgi:hypothetical protein
LSAGILLFPDAAKDLERQMFMRGRAEFGVRHNASEDLFVAFHARDEKLVEHAIQIGGEMREVVRASRLRDAMVSSISAGARI